MVARPTHVGYAVVLAALALTIPFGGLAASPEEELSAQPPGTTVSAAPWEITLDRAIYGTDLGGTFYDDEQHTHVLLLGTLRTTATSTVPVADLEATLQVSGLPGLTNGFGEPVEDGVVPMGGNVYDLRPTPQAVQAIAPGLESPVAIHLTTTERGELPDELELSFWSKTYRESSLDSSYLWTDEVETARMTLPLEASGPIYRDIYELLP